MRTITFTACLLLIPMTAWGDDWLGFRGFGGRADSPQSNPPAEFSAEEGKNIAWHAETVGRGIAGPLVVGDLVIATSCGGIDERDISVEAFDAATGKRVWVRTLLALGRPFTHPTSANAAPTPASDGEKIFALYSSCDLVCLDREGGIVWYRGLGVDHPKTGSDVSMSSSPVVIDDVVMVQLECQGDSFVAGLDKNSGKTLWHLDRPRVANFASPLAVPLPSGRQALFLSCSQSATIVDPASGEVIWETELDCKTTPSASVAGSTLVIPTAGLIAFDLTSDAPKPLWESDRLKARSASPVISGNRIYLAQGSVLVAGDLASGDEIWKQRIKGIGSQWATPVATQTGLFVFDDKGNCAVVKDNGDEAEVLAVSKIDGPMLASPAVSGDAIFARTENALWKIATK
ncbi:outer membrane biogenesis protein BamB [Rosistilla carotiformis]|uniref:Outer membrane biogenesis protein BamB n=1 Tax=Rosistilla carotiformis TaxID=2528017 RepID=A0A518JPV1_9BACT|nr:PQQ-binding-like beta-propeller repeat protein [Rosistilla carotiformis]QDV67564.1 outer membrane biogenesis protein BamB [Rosistilla carotiformis]